VALPLGAVGVGFIFKQWLIRASIVGFDFFWRNIKRPAESYFLPLARAIVNEDLLAPIALLPLLACNLLARIVATAWVQKPLKLRILAERLACWARLGWNVGLNALLSLSSGGIWLVQRLLVVLSIKLRNCVADDLRQLLYIDIMAGEPLRHFLGGSGGNRAFVVLAIDIVSRYQHRKRGRTAEEG
jgi:hypothetical protein